jgi:hypothetical protein
MAAATCELMLAAGVICGLGCALHPVVGGWVAACLCIASTWLLLIKAIMEE